MGRRIIIHAGFHKTGTTTIQAFLRQNSSVLAQQFSHWSGIYSNALIRGSVQFAVHHRDSDIEDMAKYAQLYINGDSTSHNQDVILSHEDLCGPLLTRSNVKIYDTIFHTLPALEQAIRETQVFEEIIFYFSTRSRETWIDSLYWHLVCHSFIGMSLDEFKIQFAHIPSNQDIVDELRRRHPDIQIHSSAMEEEVGKKFGLVHPFLELLSLNPEIYSGLIEIESRRVRPPEDILRRLYEINCDVTVPKPERKKIKQEILGTINPKNTKNELASHDT